MFFPIKDYNPARTVPYITVILIVLNIIIFSFQGFISENGLPYYVNRYSMVPYEITHLKNVKVFAGRDMYGYPVFEERSIPPVASILSSMFMHGSFMHLFGNMLFLWIFGNNIEDYLGKFFFLIFYMLSGLGAGFFHVLFNINSMVPVIGASGAVSGVMGAYLFLYPKARIKTLVFIIFFITFIDIPAGLFLVLWFFFQFLYAGSGGIAWLAHIGGFLMGSAIILLVKKRKSVFELFTENNNIGEDL